MKRTTAALLGLAAVLDPTPLREARACATYDCRRPATVRVRSVWFCRRCAAERAKSNNCR